jgi:hypothetical protein
MFAIQLSVVILTYIDMNRANRSQHPFSAHTCFPYKSNIVLIFGPQGNFKYKKYLISNYFLISNIRNKSTSVTSQLQYLNSKYLSTMILFWKHREKHFLQPVTSKLHHKNIKNKAFLLLYGGMGMWLGNKLMQDWIFHTSILYRDGGTCWGMTDSDT